MKTNEQEFMKNLPELREIAPRLGLKKIPKHHNLALNEYLFGILRMLAFKVSAIQSQVHEATNEDRPVFIRYLLSKC
jgi:hypothetical protein